MRVEFYICSLYLFFVNYMNTSTCNQVRKKVLSLHQQQKFSMVVFIAVHQIVTVCLIVYTTRVEVEALRRYLVKFEGSNTKTKFTRTQYKRLRIPHLVIHRLPESQWTQRKTQFAGTVKNIWRPFRFINFVEACVIRSKNSLL